MTSSKWLRRTCVLPHQVGLPREFSVYWRNRPGNDAWWLHHEAKYYCLCLNAPTTKRIRVRTPKAAAYTRTFNPAKSRTSVAYSSQDPWPSFACSKKKNNKKKLGAGLGTGLLFSTVINIDRSYIVNITLNFATFSPFVMFISMSDDREWMRGTAALQQGCILCCNELRAAKRRQYLVGERLSSLRDPCCDTSLINIHKGIGYKTLTSTADFWQGTQPTVLQLFLRYSVEIYKCTNVSELIKISRSPCRLQWTTHSYS